MDDVQLLLLQFIGTPIILFLYFYGIPAFLNKHNFIRCEANNWGRPTSEGDDNGAH